MEDTIVAISTGMNPSGIGIIRLSGEQATTIMQSIFEPKTRLDYTNLESHKLYYGNIKEGNRFIDEVLVSFMLAPHSYTKETVVEINSHGGTVVLKTILGLVLKQGARMAEPGEFTKRAFLNGRIDLSQAEAVMDIIGSHNQMALSASVDQLNGTVKQAMDQLKQELLYILSKIEVNIDYPEYEEAYLEYADLTNSVNSLQMKFLQLIKSYDNGKLIKEGIKTAIIGKPNVGKSSLLNALLNEERAIVTDIPGTTRDTLEEYSNINGILLQLIDTAGIRTTTDVVEEIGVKRAINLMERADLILFVIDGSMPLSAEDKQIIDLLTGKKVIALLNKKDLQSVVSASELKRLNPKMSIIEISAKHRLGLEELENEINQQFELGHINNSDQLMINNVRHKQALIEAAQCLDYVLQAIEQKMPVDLLAIDLKQAYQHLAEITGDHVTEDIIHQIFSRFCLGK